MLTSVNAVERFMAELRDARALAGVLVAAVGPSTADALRLAGVEPDLVPAEHSARALVEVFPVPEAGGNRRVLFPCADLAPDTIAEGLGEKGWDVRRVEAYRTVPLSAPDPALLDRVAAADALTLTATSSVAAFVALRTPEGAPVPVPGHVVCIGPTTAAAARAAGLQGVHEAWGRPPTASSPSWSATSAPAATTPRRLAAMADAAFSPPGPGAFATRRLRRLRRTPALRRLVAEARLGVDDLVAPLFVREGIDVPTPIASMPGEVQHTVDSLVVEAKRLVSLGLPGLILFGVPARKDAQGSGAWDPDGVVQVALRAVRDAVGDELVLMADLCLDEYTDHGHCGVLGPSGEVLNDPTLELYQRIALAQAEAGADVVAPERDDGRPGGRDPRRARRGRPRPGRHPGLRGQVRVRALRPLPRRGRRHHRRGRRPPGLPAGPAQRARGAGRDRPRPRARAPTWSWSSPP